MACVYICDGCGKKEPGRYLSTNPSASWLKPYSWFQRGDKDGIQDACSRECIEKIAARTGKTKTVIPNL